MQEVLFYADGKICLNTSLKSDAFAKTRFTEHLKEAGTKAVLQGSKWVFENWHFTSSQLIPQVSGENVCLTGEGTKGKCLHEILFSSQEGLILEEYALAKNHFVIARVCSLIEEAIRQGVKIIPNGTGGIFVSEDFSEFYFLPRKLFVTAAECLEKKESTELDAISINPFLAGIPALRFFEAELIYTALAKTHPFSELDPDSHREDLLDKNYVPLRNMVWALDENLSSWCDVCLSQKMESPVDPGDLPFNALHREFGLLEKGTLPEGNLLNPVIRKSDVSPEAFSQRVNREEKRRTTVLGSKRWVKKYRTPLSIVGGILLLVIVISLTVHSSKMTKPTSKSLTSMETIEMFYSALNLLDVDGVQNSSYGKDASDIVNVVSNAYVSTKARSLVTMNNMTVPPAFWLTETNSGKFNMFGLSQFEVDGIKRNIFRKGPKKNTHPKKLTEEEGEKLQNGMTEKHSANYYLVYTDGEDRLHVIFYEDSITVTYRKDRWLVTSVVQKEEEIELSTGEFYADYKTAFETAEHNPLKTAELLRTKYYWLNTSSEIIDAANWAKTSSTLTVYQLK